MTSSFTVPRLNIKIESHFATQNKELCEKYLMHHGEVLRKYNINTLNSFNPEWTKLDDCVILVARNLDNPKQILAGVRIEPWKGNNRLPLIDFLEKQEIDTSELISRNDTNNLAELCGLWVLPEAEGNGLGRIITRAAFGLLPKLGIKKSITFPSSATLLMMEQMGFKKVTSLGSNSEFIYPTQDFTSYVLQHQDSEVHVNATKKEKSFLEELNKKRVFLKQLNTKKSRLIIQYQLNLDFENTLTKKTHL